MPDLKDAIQATPLIAFLLIAVYAYRKGLPDWKEVRLAEIQLRREDIAARKEEAVAVGSLATSISALSSLFTKVDETTKELKLFLRAAMRQHEGIEERLALVEKQIEEIRARKVT